MTKSYSLEPSPSNKGIVNGSFQMDESAGKNTATVTPGTGEDDKKKDEKPSVVGYLEVVNILLFVIN